MVTLPHLARTARLPVPTDVGVPCRQAVGSGTPSAFYATSACADPNNLEEPQCGNDQVGNALKSGMNR